MEQQVRKKGKPRIEFKPDKVFGPGAATELGADLGPKAGESLEGIAREADIAAATYRARKGEGGDRSRPYGII